MSDEMDETREVLESTLNQGDREHLQEIYREVNNQLRWGRILDNAFPILLEMAEELVKPSKMAKEGGPWHTVYEEEQDLFKEEDPKAMARRHSLLLLLAKKLLGGLKTRVNQAAAAIRVLSPEDELDLYDLIEAGKEEEEEVEKTDEEANPVVRKIEVVAQLEREETVEIDLSLAGNCLQNGRHIRTTMRRRRKNENSYMETYCRDCHRVVKCVCYKTEGETAPIRCFHAEAEWVEGKEGREAQCSKCQEPIRDPSVFKWSDVGLEPFGDDPDQDEVITLQTYTQGEE